MFTFSKRHYGFVVLVLALLIKGVNLGDFCRDMVDSFIVGGIGLLFFMALLVVTFYNLYHISIKKEFYDFVTPLFLIIFSGLFYVAMVNPTMDFHKTKEATFQLKTSHQNPYDLTLYSDGSFLLTEKDGQQDCYTKGYYKRDGMQLSLNFHKDQSFNKTYRFEKNQDLLIGKDTLQSKLGQ